MNTNEYSWADIEVVMLGRPVIGITSVMYKTSRGKTNVYGRGKKPVARVRGQEEYEASITLNQSEVEALQQSVGKGKKLTDIPPFDITIVYAPENSVQLTTDVLRFCEFTEVEKALNNQQDNMEVTLPLIVGDIDYNQ
jgi:hypothetical protein